MDNKGGILMQRFELGRLLGQGTFAKVYHARNLKSGQSVAIKVIDKEKVLKVGMIDQIKREISTMRLASHPNVVQLYEVMATKTKIYFVLEYVKGGELFNKVAKGKLKDDPSSIRSQLSLFLLLLFLTFISLSLSLSDERPVNVKFGKMAAGPDVSSPLTVLEGGTSMEPPTEVENIGKPPRNISVIRHCMSSARLAEELDLVGIDSKSPGCGKSGFLPVFRSGSHCEIGPKQYMEDEHICIDNLLEHLGEDADVPSPGAFYGVFDGHGGTDAASFIRKNILKFILEDSHFPACVEKAIKSAFVKADHAFADAHTLDSSSGTTALVALIFGRTMLIANAGDCRAVLGKRGRAVELSRDHKPNCSTERLRIEKLGGIIYDGYLCGQLSVARALGDWHMKGAKGSACPLSAEPELQTVTLAVEDEFLIMGCDGLWDVMSSQCAVTIVRKELMQHNDPERCSWELVREALKRNTCDNLTVIVICFSPDPPPRIEIPRARMRSISADSLNFLKGVLESNI